MIESLNIFGRLSLFFFVYNHVLPRLIPSLSPPERECMYRQGIVARTAIQDDSMRPVISCWRTRCSGEFKEQGQKFFEVRCTHTFPRRYNKVIGVGRKRETQHTSDRIPALHTSWRFSEQVRITGAWYTYAVKPSVACDVHLSITSLP